jgi:alkylated DNA nucleotide flippase Atl1
MGEYLPFWRTIKNDGSLNPKYPGGIEKQREKLEEEGFSFVQRGRKHIRYHVEDYEKYLE